MATILVVDDNATDRDYLVTLLGKSGHDLMEAVDGSEALAAAKAQKPDLIIADVLMPSMDGCELVQQLRADAALANVPVIFWTARYHERDAQKLAQSCGVGNVVTKPSEPETILAAVRGALNEKAPAECGIQREAEADSQNLDREHLRLMTEKLSQSAEELRASNERISAMMELSTQLASELDPRRLVQCFADSLRQIAGARYTIAGLLNSDGSRFQYVFTSGMSPEAAAKLSLPDPAAPSLSAILKSASSQRKTNPGGDPKSFGLPEPHPPVHSWLAASIASPDRVHGFVALIDKLGASEFSAEEERMTCTLAAQVGRIYRTTSLYAEATQHAAILEREIAAHAQTEAMLRDREQHIRLLLDSTAEAIFGMDTEGRCTFANASCARLLGFNNAAELIGWPMHPLIHHTRKDGAPHPAEECRIFSAYQENRGVHCDDDVLWRADGTSFPVEYWSHPTVADGKVVGVVVTFLDISNRRQLERQFERSQQHLHAVLISSPAILFTLGVTSNRMRHATWVSDNLTAVLGYPAQAALNSRWWNEYVHPDDRGRIEKDSNTQLFTTGVCAEEYRFMHADGAYRWVDSHIRLVRDEEGRPVEAVGVLTDITERKRAEEEHSKLRQQLLQAQKLESVGRLAGGVAHDFNNLLTVINGYSDLLVERLPSEGELQDMVSEIGIAGKRAAELTRQLLLLSRKQLTQAVPVNLNDVVREVERMLARVIGEDILVECDLNQNLGRVMADPGQMHQVLMNLAVNARDAMPDGGTLLIETRNTDLDSAYAEQHADVPPGPYVELKVSDTGSGMSKETLSHLFEPFFTTKKAGEGTGLGLATVYGIVKQAAGSIWVYSELGKGTSFKIYLPRVDARAAGTLDAKTPVEGLRGTETILLAEDQQQLLKMASGILQRYGYTVIEAISPQQALVEAERYPGEIHLLLTDIVMPQMTGVELATCLKVSRPAIQSIFMSGYSERVVPERRDIKGSYLTKPFSPDELVEKVRETLGAPKSTGVILVVDDEAGIRKLLRNMLTGAGFQVLEAESGKQAVTMMQSANVDLVIIDLAMPEQEGFETMTILRNAHQRLKIIAMSGRFAGPLLRAAEVLGAQASIAKPIKQDELLALVARVMGERR